MAMFSRFFVLGPRGDTLIVKEYQGHISPKTATPQDFWSRSVFLPSIDCSLHRTLNMFTYVVLPWLQAPPRNNISPYFFCRVQESSELSPVIDINGVRLFHLHVGNFAHDFCRCIASRNFRTACSLFSPPWTTFLRLSVLKCWAVL